MAWHLEREHERIARTPPLAADPVPAGRCGARRRRGGRRAAAGPPRRGLRRDGRRYPECLADGSIAQGAHGPRMPLRQGRAEAASRWARVRGSAGSAFPRAAGALPATRARADAASGAVPALVHGEQSIARLAQHPRYLEHVLGGRAYLRALPDERRAVELLARYHGRPPPWPFVLMAWERWQSLPPEQKERYRRQAREAAAKGRAALAGRASARPGAASRTRFSSPIGAWRCCSSGSHLDVLRLLHAEQLPPARPTRTSR